MSVNIDQGIDWVRTRKYAFILPDVVADYIVRREPCDLAMIGQLLPSRGYGLAVRPRDELVLSLNVGIKDLIRRGVIDKMYEKWWKTWECSKPDYLKVQSSASWQHSFKPHFCIQVLASLGLLRMLFVTI